MLVCFEILDIKDDRVIGVAATAAAAAIAGLLCLWIGVSGAETGVSGVVDWSPGGSSGGSWLIGRLVRWSLSGLIGWSLSLTNVSVVKDSLTVARVDGWGAAGVVAVELGSITPGPLVVAASGAGDGRRMCKVAALIPVEVGPAANGSAIRAPGVILNHFVPDLVQGLEIAPECLGCINRVAVSLPFPLAVNERLWVALTQAVFNGYSGRGSGAGVKLIQLGSRRYQSNHRC